MKNYIYKFTTILAATAFLQSCASSQAKNTLEEKLATEPAITSEKTLEVKQKDTIASAEGLSDEQRRQLNELRATSQAKAKEMEAQSLKLREILVKNLVASDYGKKNANEVRVIKTQLAKLNRQRLDLTLDSIEKAQVILGRQAQGNEGMMNSFLERDFDSRETR